MAGSHRRSSPAEWGYGLLLRLYPADVRRRHGPEMWTTFRRRLAEARGHPRAFSRLRVWGREITATVAAGLPERLASVRRAVRSGISHHSFKTTLEASVHHLLQDLRYAVRTLRKNIGFAAIVVVTLGLGIGANTAIFSVVDGVLLTPLRFPDSDRLIGVWGRFLPESGFDFEYFPLSPPEFFDYRDQNETLSHLAAISRFNASLTGDGAPERVAAESVSSSYFPLLGVQPLLGRTFSESEDVLNGPRVAVLSHPLWRDRFGADSAILGRTILVNSQATEVIGVMPEGFALSPDARLWMPIGLDPVMTNRSSHWFTVIGRRQPGVSMEAVATEMETLMERWRADFPDIHTGHFLLAQRLLDNFVVRVRPALTLLLGAVGFVLLIVCANVANVLLARGEHRHREIAVRAALGANRRRLAQQLLTESAVLTGLGAALGVGLATAGVKWLLSLDGHGLPRTDMVAIDGRVLLFTLGVSAAAGVIFGLVPLRQAFATDLQGALKDSGPGAGTGKGRIAFRRVLVVAEVGLSLALVVGAGLMVRSFGALLQVDPGFVSERTLLGRLELPAADYTGSEANRFFGDLLQRVRAHPGVLSASASSAMPLYTGFPNWDFEVEGLPPVEAGEPARSGYIAFVHPQFFETTGIPLRQGRYLNDTDVEGGLKAVVINERMAEMYWPGEDPIGKRIRFGQPDWLSVVGVVGNVRVDGLDRETRATRYVPALQAAEAYEFNTRRMAVVIRTSGEPTDVATALRAAVRQLDPNATLQEVVTMEDVLSDSVAQPRFTMLLLTTFALLALVLGAIGIYGVMSYTVAQRMRELGIRVALGARGSRVAGLVIGQGMALTGIGLLAGLALSLAGGRFIQGLLFGVSPYDPVTLATVPLVLGSVAFLACIVPARRAAKAEPMATLRTD